MKDFAGIVNTSGTFPSVVAQNDTTPGSLDGTPLVKQWVDEIFGSYQALLNFASLTPSGTAELYDSSQILDALKAGFLNGIEGGTYSPSASLTWNQAWIVDASAGSGTNVIGVTATGKGSSPGVSGTGGSSNGYGILGNGGGSNGAAVRGIGTSVTTAAGVGSWFTGGSPSSSGNGANGAFCEGGDAPGSGTGGDGVYATGGDSASGTAGVGVEGHGGVTDGIGVAGYGGSTDGIGVQGVGDGTGCGVSGLGDGASMSGISSDSEGAGVVGIGSTSDGPGGYFVATSGGTALYANYLTGASGYGIVATGRGSDYWAAIKGSGASDNCNGVWGDGYGTGVGIVGCGAGYSGPSPSAAEYGGVVGMSSLLGTGPGGYFLGSPGGVFVGRSGYASINLSPEDSDPSTPSTGDLIVTSASHPDGVGYLKVYNGSAWVKVGTQT